MLPTWRSRRRETVSSRSRAPERAPFNEIVARYLKAVGDPRVVVSDPEARYYGGRVEEFLTKTELCRAAMEKLKVSKNSFNVAWINAIEQTGRRDWYQPLRRRFRTKN